MYYGKRKKRAARSKQKGKKASGGLRGRRGESEGHFLSGLKREEEKILIKEGALEFMKNMNQQELVDVLLSNDDWHVKTSGINSSGN